MKKLLLAALVAGAFATSAIAQEVDLSTDPAKLSYSLGLMVGERITKRYGDIDYDTLLAGLKAAHEGADTAMSMEEARTVLETYEKKAAAEASSAAIAKGEAFLAENKAKDGVEVTESGLQYEVITAAEGAKPSVEDTVSVHYVGTLINGDEFDSSVARGQPAEFPLGQVIKGWTEGLQLMNVGSKYRFVIPADLAYGERGSGAIGPNETLIFEVELLEIKEAG